MTNICLPTITGELIEFFYVSAELFTANLIQIFNPQAFSFTQFFIPLRYSVSFFLNCQTIK